MIETPRISVDKDAIIHASSLCRVDPQEIRSIAEQTINTLRTIRSLSTSLNEEAVLEEIQNRFKDAKLCPLDIVNRLTAQKVSSMPVGKAKKPNEKK